MHALTFQPKSYLNLVLIGLVSGFAGPASANADKQLAALMEQTYAVRAVDNRCDVLTLEGRIAADLTDRQIGRAISAKYGPNGVGQRSRVAKGLTKSLNERLAPGCESYSKEPVWQRAVAQWNQQGLQQLAVLADPTLHAVCKLDGPEHARLRTEAARAQSALQAFPQETWLPALTQRRAVHRQSCEATGALKEELNNVTETAYHMPDNYKSVQALEQTLGQAIGRLATLGKIVGLRDLPGGPLAVMSNPTHSHPHTLSFDQDAAVRLKFSEDTRGDIGSVSVRAEGSDDWTSFRVGDDKTWTLRAEDLADLIKTANQSERPMIYIRAETWSRVQSSAPTISVARVAVENLNRALGYANASKVDTHGG